jgi:hypothetical protein
VLIGHAWSASLRLLHSCSNNFLTSSLAAEYGGGVSFLPRAAARTFFSVLTESLKKSVNSLMSCTVSNPLDATFTFGASSSSEDYWLKAARIS